MPTPTEPAPPGLHVDLLSFDAAERLEIQTHFDCHYRDLVLVVQAEFVTGANEESHAAVDRAGIRHFPDQILMFLMWVTARRTAPDVTLESFATLRWPDLRESLIAPKVDGGGPTRPRRS
jgi:hypothetical protein